MTHRTDDGTCKTRVVCKAATISIYTGISLGRKELIDGVVVCALGLHTVKACFGTHFGCGLKVTNDFGNVIEGEVPGWGMGSVCGKRKVTVFDEYWEGESREKFAFSSLSFSSFYLCRNQLYGA